MNAPRLSAAILFEPFDLADDGIEFGPVAGIELGMEQFAIGANFKRASARGNESKRFDAFAEFKNFGRQTDGLGRVVSNHAILDRNFGFHAMCSFPTKMVRKSRQAVKMSIFSGDRPPLQKSAVARRGGSFATGFSSLSAAEVIGEYHEQFHHWRFVIHAEER
jgi:hypothetical protein